MCAACRPWYPLPASIAGGAGARPDHPISIRDTTKQKAPDNAGGLEFQQRLIGLFCDEWRSGRSAGPRDAVIDAEEHLVHVLRDVDGKGNTSGYSYAREGHVLGPKALVIIFDPEIPFRGKHPGKTDASIVAGPCLIAGRKFPKCRVYPIKAVVNPSRTGQPVAFDGRAHQNADLGDCRSERVDFVVIAFSRGHGPLITSRHIGAVPHSANTEHQVTIDLVVAADLSAVGPATGVGRA